MAWLGLEAEEYDRKYSDSQLGKRILEYLRPYRGKVGLVVLFLTLSSLANGVIPWISSIMINSTNLSGNLTSFILLLSAMFLLNATGFVFNYYRQNASVKIIGNIVYDLQKNAQEHVLNQDFYFFDHYPVGKLVSRINSDSQNFGDMAELLAETISSFLVVVILFIPMFLINATLSWGLVAIIPIVFIIALSYRRLARRRTLLGQRSLALVNNFVEESLTGIQIAKTFRQEQKLFDKFKQVNAQSYKVNLNRAILLNLIFPSLDFCWGTLIALLIFFGGSMIQSGILSPGTLYLFLQSAWNLYYPLFGIATFWPQFQNGLAAAERIFALIDANRVVVQKDSKTLELQTGQIDFDNVNFEYVPGKKVFEDFSLHIQPGESIAIVGHTGAGKSTIAKLLARFYEFQDGDIKVEGESIRNLDLEFFRRQIGYIPQVPFLFADSLENNVKYGNPDATHEDILWALDQAGGSDWIYDLPQGLETDLNERGKLLSMGQRQLVAFARILLEKPKILILDEATASVDPFTETRIQDALEEIMKGRTSIIIAHRLWTVRKVNRIIVIDNGKIVEEGSHDVLMAQGGYYANLYNTYFRHQSLEFIEQQGRTDKEI